MAQMASAWPAAAVIWTVLAARLAGAPKPWPGGLVTALPASSTTNEPAGVAVISPPLPESAASWAGAVQPPPREWRDVSGTQVMVDPMSTFWVSSATALPVPFAARPEATVDVLGARMTGAVQVPPGLRVAACTPLPPVHGAAPCPLAARARCTPSCLYDVAGPSLTGADQPPVTVPAETTVSCGEVVQPARIALAGLTARFGVTPVPRVTGADQVPPARKIAACTDAVELPEAAHNATASPAASTAT